MIAIENFDMPECCAECAICKETQVVESNSEGFRVVPVYKCGITNIHIQDNLLSHVKENSCPLRDLDKCSLTIGVKDGVKGFTLSGYKEKDEEFAIIKGKEKPLADKMYEIATDTTEMFAKREWCETIRNCLLSASYGYMELNHSISIARSKYVCDMLIKEGFTVEFLNETEYSYRVKISFKKDEDNADAN